MFFPRARENHGRSKITQKKAMNNNRWAKQTRADIQTPFKIQKKQHSIIQKRLWEKAKAFFAFHRYFPFSWTNSTPLRSSTPLRRQTQEQGEQQAGKQPFIGILNSFKPGEMLFIKSRERDFAIAEHCSVHLLFRKSAPESYFLDRISYIETLSRCEDPEKRKNWTIRYGWEYSSLSRIIKQIKGKTCLSLGD